MSLILPSLVFVLIEQHYIGIPVYVFGYLGYKIIRKTSAIAPVDIDFTTGSREDADFAEDEEDIEEAYRYKGMSFGQKVLYKIKNWQVESEGARRVEEQFFLVVALSNANFGG